MSKLLTFGRLVFLASLTAAVGQVSAATDLNINAVRDGRVEAELIAEHTALVPGETAQLGLRLKMDDGWHTYWKNPGDSGMATMLDWELPDGFVAHEIDWPAPDFFEVGGLASYAYEGEIVLPVRLDVPSDFAGEAVTLRATADWLVCKELCEPGSAALALALPVAEDASSLSIDSSSQELFAWSDANQPRAAKGGGVDAFRHPESFTLTVSEALGPAADTSGWSARFFPASPMAIAMGEPQEHAFAPDGSLRMTLPPNTLSEPPSRLRGVLVLRHGEQVRPYEIDVPLRDVADGKSH